MRTSNPHDGTIRSGALALELTDICIRYNLKVMAQNNTIHLIYSKLRTKDAVNLLNNILASNDPLPHPVRVLLAEVLQIECPMSDRL